MKAPFVILAALSLPAAVNADIISQHYSMNIWVPDFNIDPPHETTVYLGSWDSASPFHLYDVLSPSSPYFFRADPTDPRNDTHALGSTDGSHVTLDALSGYPVSGFVTSSITFQTGSSYILDLAIQRSSTFPAGKAGAVTVFDQTTGQPVSGLYDPPRPSGYYYVGDEYVPVEAGHIYTVTAGDPYGGMHGDYSTARVSFTVPDAAKSSTLLLAGLGMLFLVSGSRRIKAA
jgi:hypothetical protein